MVETLASYEPAKDLEPFLALVVAQIVIDQVHAEHVEFVLVPPADNVQTGPAMADMVDGCHGLGREHRVHERHVDGYENGNPRGEGRKCRALGQGLERPRGIVELATVAAPAGERKQ